MNINIDNNIYNIFTNDINKLNISGYVADKKYNLNDDIILNENHLLHGIGKHSDIINILDDNYINNTEGDALITNQINKPMIIKVADCIPIILYDRENKVIALVHSGWKGTLKKIIITN